MKYFKLEIFIPETHLEELQGALREAGAGKVGNYDSCLAYSRVRGRWRALDGASPYTGAVGAMCEEEELKVEVNVSQDCLDATLRAIREIHPYEIPVINVIALS